MYNLSFTNQFSKDYKKAVKSNLDIEKLHTAYKILEATGTLPREKYKTHLLKGDYQGHHEAHIEPDWLLIWLRKSEDIRLVRTGTHSELFS